MRQLAPLDPATDCTACTSRRSVLVAGVGSAAALALAGCGGSGDPDQSGDVGGEAPVGSAPAAAAGGVLTAAADVPVGGGIILTDQGVVVTQPVEGTFVGFSSTCTHSGCAVTTVADGLITCPCHGSTFAVADGAVTNGPAAEPLAAIAVTVSGTDVVLA